MIRPTIAVCACVLFACFASGCKDNAECDKARFALSKTWRGIAESSAKRQLAGVDIEGWKFMQEKAALLESSFMTTQVTWDSADKARKELSARLPGLQSDVAANVTGYRLAVDAALKEQDAFAQKCR